MNETGQRGADQDPAPLRESDAKRVAGEEAEDRPGDAVERESDAREKEE